MNTGYLVAQIPVPQNSRLYSGLLLPRRADINDAYEDQDYELSLVVLAT